jgi:hypothetical protein
MFFYPPVTTSVLVHVNHWHPVQSTLFYFMWQWFLRYIHQPAWSFHSFLRPYQSNMLPSMSSTLPVVLCRQASTYIYIRHLFTALEIIQTLIWSTFIYVFSGPSLTFIRRKRMHGYTSLIRSRPHSTSTATFREQFPKHLTLLLHLSFANILHTNGKDDLVHLLPFTLRLQQPITCLVFNVAKSACLHFTHQTETSLFSYINILANIFVTTSTELW